MCPRQWEVMNSVLVSDTWFLSHTFCALNELFEVTSFHPVSPPGAVTEAGSIRVAAQLHTTLQMIRSESPCTVQGSNKLFAPSEGTHGETAHLNLRKACHDLI